MREPLVSIIIPCYNYGNFLMDAVNSVCSQTYTRWECIIVDDGSTDDSGSIAQGLAKENNQVYYYYKKNGGLSSTRNYGIHLAKGEYICFLDADDLFDKEKLEKQVYCFEQNPSAGIVYGKAGFFEKDNVQVLYQNKEKREQSELRTFSGQGDALIKLLTDGNITVVSSPMIKSEVFKKVGDFDLSYKSYEDWHFWMRCALAGFQFVYAPEPEFCTYIRFGHESMMSDKRKLIMAGIQLRKFMAVHLPAKFKLYNSYRLLRTRLKLLFL